MIPHVYFPLQAKRKTSARHAVLCISAFFGILLTGGTLLGCDSLSGSSPSGPGTVHGTITNASSGEPVKNARVAIRPNEAQTSTGEAGQFNFSEREAGSYTVEAARVGFKTNRTDVSLPAGGDARADLQLKPVDQSLLASKATLDFGTQGTSRSFELKVNKGNSVSFELEVQPAWLACTPSSGETNSLGTGQDSSEAEPNFRPTPQPPQQPLADQGKGLPDSPDTPAPETSRTPGSASKTSVATTDSAETKSTGIVCTADREGVGPGTYETTIIARSDRAGTAEVTARMEVLGPEVGVSPSELDFGTQKTLRTLGVTNEGVGQVDYSIETTAEVLTATPTSGSVSGEQEDRIEVELDRSGVEPGNYERTIAVDAGEIAGTETVNVWFVVEDPNAPQLSVFPNQFNFGTEKEDMEVEVTNTGTGTLDWETEGTDEPWYSLSKESGQLDSDQTAVLTVSVDRRNRPPGEYTDTATFTSSDGGSQPVEIRMRVLPEPVLVVDKDSLDFGHAATGRSFQVSNSGNGTLRCAIGTTKSWLSASPDSTTGLTDVNVEVSRSGTSIGDHAGKVQLDCGSGGTGEVAVSMTHRAENQPPTARFEIFPDPAYLDTVVTVDASAVEDDYTSRDNLEVRVRWTENGPFNSWLTDKTRSHDYSETGEKTITLEVRDEEGRIGRKSKTAEVVENESPTASLSVVPEEGGTTTTFDFEVEASDDVTSPSDLQYRWRPTTDGTWSSWGGSTSYSHRFDASGNRTTTVQVRDGRGETTEKSITVSISGDEEPNDSRDQATLIAWSASINGSVSYPNYDWFKIESSKNGIVRFNIEFQNSFPKVRILLENNSGNKLIDVKTGNNYTTEFVAISEGNTYYTGIKAVHSSDYQVTGLPHEVEQDDFGEPNNSIEGARVVSDTASLAAIVGFENDPVDWYRFTASSSGSLYFQAENLQRNGANVGDLKRVRLYASSDTTDVLTSAPEHFRLEPGESATSPSVQVEEGTEYVLVVEPDLEKDAAPYRIDLSR